MCPEIIEGQGDEVNQAGDINWATFAGETVIVAGADISDPDDESRPDKQWIRETCPECGDDLVSNMYYIPSKKSYFVAWECWASLGEEPTCKYRRIL